MAKDELIRVNITVPPDWPTVLAAAAKRRGLTITEWTRGLWQADMPASVRRQLSPIRPRGRPKKGS